MEPIESRAAAFEHDMVFNQLRVSPHDWSFHVGGDGEAVVLLPGGAGIAIGWLDLTPALCSEFRVVAVDYSPTATSFGELADGVVAILDAEGMSSAHVVGQSAGGMLAEVLSRRAPDRVRSIVFTGTGLYGPEDVARLEARLAATESTPWEQTRASAREALRSIWKGTGEAEFWVQRSAQVPVMACGLNHALQLAMSVAAGSAKLLGLDAARTADAIAASAVDNVSLAATHAEPVSAWKASHPPLPECAPSTPPCSRTAVSPGRRRCSTAPMAWPGCSTGRSTSIPPTARSPLSNRPTSSSTAR